jgi:hypothetical protein
MKPEFPPIDQDKAVAPKSQEVEFALLLSRMINTVKEDPSQMRLAIYEFARARLQTDTTWAEAPERERLSAALETAIEGVEQFSARDEDKLRLQPPNPSALSGPGVASIDPSSRVSIYQVDSAPIATLVSTDTSWRPQAVPPILDTRSRLVISSRAWLWIGVALIGAIAGLAGYHQRVSLLQVAGVRSPPAEVIAKPAAPASPQASSPAGDGKTASISPGSQPFPVPSDYGVYALDDGSLSELIALANQVPDKRVAMSTPINQPSRTTLADGKAKFVLYRRELAGNAPDRIDVRVVARVARAVTFDSKGKPNFTPVSDAWNIRNISYEYRVRPLPGNPEMLLVLAADPDFVLPSGRYVLALQTQAYDFTVPGKITDPSQCLERTEAANGEFYSACQKQ